MSKEKLTSLTLSTSDIITLRDSLGAWVSLIAEDYQNNPNLEKARKMDDAINLLDRMKGKRNGY